MGGELYDVPAALKRLGLDYEERFGEAWRRCPGHFGRTGREDASPSWSINLASGKHHCFSCGYGGNLPHLVSGMLRIGHTEAEAWLADPMLLAAAVEARLGARARRTGGARGEIDLSRFTLPPLHELAARRITLEAAVRYEILWDGRGFILPLRDASAVLIGYQIKRGHYVRNRPLRVPKSLTLFGLGAFTGEAAVLVESPLDCARLWCAGIDGALACFGSAVSGAQVELLVATARRVVIALDNDNSGEVGADAVETALNFRIPSQRFAYPGRPGTCGKDPGELKDEEIWRGIAQARTRLQRLTEASTKGFAHDQAHRLS